MNILAQFWTTLRVDRYYLHTKTSYRQPETGVANYRHSYLIRWTLAHKMRRMKLSFDQPKTKFFRRSHLGRCDI